MFSCILGKALDETRDMNEKSIEERVKTYLEKDDIFIHSLAKSLKKYLELKKSKKTVFFDVNDDVLCSMILFGIFNPKLKSASYLLETMLNEKKYDMKKFWEYSAILGLEYSAFGGYSNEHAIEFIEKISPLIINLNFPKEKIDLKFNIVSENQLSFLLYLQSENYEEALDHSLRLGYASNMLTSSLAYLKYGIPSEYWNIVMEHLNIEEARIFIETEKYILERKKINGIK